MEEFKYTEPDENEELPEMPEECPESEEAIEKISERSQDEKFTFINVIVLAIVLLGCAAYFISMTSSKRYGDEGNKFSLERLANGKYTAEISKRYYSSIAYPDGIKKLADNISRLYGITEGKPEDVLSPEEKKPETVPDVSETSVTRAGHDEKEVTTAKTDEAGGKDKKTKASKTGTVKYSTKFYHTTTEGSKTTEDTEETEETTTTNNTAPVLTSTTTEKPTERTHKETTEQTESLPDESEEESSTVTEESSESESESETEDSSSKQEEDSSAPEDDSTEAEAPE